MIAHLKSAQVAAAYGFATREWSPCAIGASAGFVDSDNIGPTRDGRVFIVLARWSARANKPMKRTKTK